MKALIFLAPGFEETEAVAVIDLLRRAKVEVVLVSVGAVDFVTSARGISVKADLPIEKIKDGEHADLYILPGGMPGSENLAKSERLGQLLNAQKNAGRWIAAVCAAPTVLEKHGLLAGEKTTSHPSVEADLKSAAAYLKDKVVVSGKVVTSRGVGTTIDFALALVSLLAGKEKSEEIRKAIVYDHE